MNTDEFLSARPVDISSWEESQYLEWKETTSNIKDIVNTVCAFANTSGGTVVCGVSDSGKIPGMVVEDSTLRSVTQSILANTEERILASIQRMTLEKKSVVVIDVLESPLKPHLSYGKCFKRVGPANISVGQAEYRSMLANKQNGHGADRDLVPELSISEINSELLYRFIELANEKRAGNISTLADPMVILTNLELAHNGVLTKGAVLLFGENPQKVVPSAEIRAALFEDATKKVFLDQEIIGGTLFTQFESAITFVKKHIALGTNTHVVGNRATSEFPLSAVQEIVANALVHRDYHDPASIYLNLTKGQSIEVNNPGMLPEPRVTVDTMSSIHPSIPRNRRLARVFYLAGLIEQWGLGGQRIALACRTEGLKEPVWRSERGTVSVEIAREGKLSD